MMGAHKNRRGLFQVSLADAGGAIAVHESRDDFATMEDDSLSIALAWEPKQVAVSGQFRFIIGYDSESASWKCARCMSGGGDLVPFLNGATEKEIVSGVGDPLGLDATDTLIFADLPTADGETTLYISQTLGETWESSA